MMNTADPASFASNLCTSFKSDDLPKLTRLLKHVEPLKDDVDLFQVRLILDANVILRALRWMCKKSNNPKARTELVELLDCKVVEGFAPTYLLTELEKNISEVCAKQKIDEPTMRARWEEIRGKINFIDVGGPGDSNDKSLVDPKDLPYLRLQEKLNAPIVSEDGHIERMGGKTIRIEVLSPLRAYSRKTAIEYNLKVLGIGSFFVAAAVGSALASGIKSAAGKARRMPKLLLIFIALFVIVALLHPTSRKAIINAVKKLLAGFRTAAGVVFEQLMPLIDSHYEAKSQAAGQLEAFTERLG
jgi:predicted nucleic acid-binding protein